VVALAVVVLAGLGAACSSDDVGADVDVAAGLETTVRDFVRARSLADLDEGRAQSPVSQYVSTRCQDEDEAPDPVFAFSSIRGYDATIAGDEAVVSYDIRSLPGVNVDETPGTGIAPPGPPIEVRDERWTRASGSWRWDGC
jgi:hypothetical protein